MVLKLSENLKPGAPHEALSEPLCVCAHTPQTTLFFGKSWSKNERVSSYKLL
jgi:hypothetical protein